MLVFSLLLAGREGVAFAFPPCLSCVVSFSCATEPPIIVFTNTKKNADALARHIGTKLFLCCSFSFACVDLMCVRLCGCLLSRLLPHSAPRFPSSLRSPLAEIAGFSVTVLHGGKIQDQRESALDAFKVRFLRRAFGFSFLLFRSFVFRQVLFAEFLICLDQFID